MGAVQVRNPVLREYCVAALKYYHPHSWRSGGYGSRFHSLWCWIEEDGAVASILLLTTNLHNVYRKAKSLYPELKDIKYDETLFIKRILNIPPHERAVDLLLSIEQKLAKSGVKALFSYVYPGLPGKLYQHAKYKFGWRRGGFTFVYKIIA